MVEKLQAFGVRKPRTSRVVRAKFAVLNNATEDWVMDVLPERTVTNVDSSCQGKTGAVCTCLGLVIAR